MIILKIKKEENLRSTFTLDEKEKRKEEEGTLIVFVTA